MSSTVKWWVLLAPPSSPPLARRHPEQAPEGARGLRKRRREGGRRSGRWVQTAKVHGEREAQRRRLAQAGGRGRAERGGQVAHPMGMGRGAPWGADRRGGVCAPSAPPFPSFSLPLPAPPPPSQPFPFPPPPPAGLLTARQPGR